MSERKLEYFFKVLIILSGVGGIIFFVGIILGVVFHSAPNEIVSSVLWIGFAFFALFGFLLTVFVAFKGLVIPAKELQADKIPYKFDCYNEFFNYIENTLIKNSYTKQKALSCESVGEVTLFTKVPEIWTLDCFAIIQVSELSEDILKSAYNKTWDILKNYYNGKTIRDTVNLIYIFCVDKITPSFIKLVNTELQQDLKLGTMIVGISFEDKSAYVARQKNGVCLPKYKQLRNEAYYILEL